MPRGKLVSKSELQRTAIKPAAKRGRPPKNKTEVRASRKQSIAKVSQVAKPVGRPKAAAHPHHPAISITLQIPSLRRTKTATKLPQPAEKPKRRRIAKWIPVAAMGVIALAGGALYFVMPSSAHHPVATAAAAGPARKTPDYQPLMLADQQPTDQSFDGNRDLVSYSTTFSEVRITVSEQPLPANFKTNPAALLQAADSINAKERVDTNRGPVFIATNEPAGDQLAVFADSQVLGFIHTDHKMDDGTWKSFVEQLKPINWQNTKQD